MLSADRLRELLDYCPETGQFTWRVAANNNGAPKGAVAGCTRKDGRRVIRINKKLYLASRLAWLHTYGEWPESQVDHKNVDHSDDSIDNLRLATQSQNNCNQRLRKQGGIKGVNWYAARNKWVASITVDGKLKSLGYFTDPQLAAATVAAARVKYHGEFANHG